MGEGRHCLHRRAIRHARRPDMGMIESIAPVIVSEAPDPPRDPARPPVQEPARVVEQVTENAPELVLPRPPFDYQQWIGLVETAREVWRLQADRQHLADALGSSTNQDVIAIVDGLRGDLAQLIRTARHRLSLEDEQLEQHLCKGAAGRPSSH